MSEFKVGDYIVVKNDNSDAAIFDDWIYQITRVKEKTVDVKIHDREVYYEMPKWAIQHATPEELAAGNRLDHIKIQVSYGIKLNDLGVVTMGFDPGKDITHDLGDDSHIENHISPLCKSKDV